MRRRRRAKLISDINVVPYLDVMLVLLVIFMITAPLFNQGVVDLPSVGENADVGDVPTDGIIVNFEIGKISLGEEDSEGQPLNRKETINRIADILFLEPNRSIVIGVDADASHGDVMRFYSELRDGISEREIEHKGRIGFVVEAE